MNPPALPRPPRPWLTMPSYTSDIKMCLEETDFNGLRNPTSHISARVINFLLWNISNQHTESREAQDLSESICFLPSTV